MTVKEKTHGLEHAETYLLEIVGTHTIKAPPGCDTFDLTFETQWQHEIIWIVVGSIHSMTQKEKKTSHQHSKRWK